MSFCKNKILRVILYVFCWLVASFFLFYFAYRGSRDTTEKYQSEIDSIYSKIEFSGEIMNIYETNHGGRPNGVICVRIDTANLTEFYRFNKYTCLKIHKGIATIPTECPHLISEAKYVEVNKNKNMKMVFYNMDKKVILEYDLSYWSPPVKEYDMWRCDTCQ
jgi:hypothetical protein